MAVMLKSSAVSAASKGTKSSFYSGYGGKPNPVFQALEQDLDAYKTFMQKRVGRRLKRPKDEASSIASDRLFDIWNKYESRLPTLSYQKRLLEMGDFLSSIKEFNLALWLCYGRYLTSFGEVNVEEITSVEQFKKEFFLDGFETEDAGFTFRALMGRSICTYEVVRMNDPKLLNTESVDKCLQLLSFLRLVTQVILPKESLNWLLYNGTIHIYSISRHLMSFGHSAAVLEFMLWVAMCMEASIPLLGVKYVDWRTTLYTAVCQCYYDCKAGQHAEAFARRALSKLNELSQLEYMSSAKQSIEVERTFRLATVKMGIMVFKRTVFETRKRPKGLLRPKTRANLKDAALQPWPRTQSEKLLAEMFEGSSAQILCLLETLTDSNRRTLLSCPPAPDSDVEILDVFAELFMAAQEIIAGGGGLSSVGGALSKKDIDLRSLTSLKGVINERPLTEMAAMGDDGIPLSAVIKLVKLGYCYEQWEFFDNMIEPVLYAIKEVENDKFLREGKCLEITQAYDRVSPRFKHRRLFIVTDEDDDAEAATTGPATSLPAAQSASKSTIVSQPDDLIRLAEVLLSVVTGPFTTETMDMDMMIDACLLLWNKCKNVFQKFQTGSADNPRYLQKMDNPSKWVYILDIVHQVLGWCGLSAVDPALMAEVVLRLALVFEASATLELSQDRKPKPGGLIPYAQPACSKSSIGRFLNIKTCKSLEPWLSDDLSTFMVQSSFVSLDSSLPTRPVTPFPIGSQEILKQTIIDTHKSDTADLSFLSDLMSSRPESQRTTLMSDGGKESYTGGVSQQNARSVSVTMWRHQQEQAARDQLVQARDILEFGLQNVSYSRQVVALTDGKSIADISWVKELNKELFSPVNPAETEEREGKGQEDGQKETGAVEKEQSNAMAVWNMVRDLHLELIFMYHRICVKLGMLGPDKKKQKQPQEQKSTKHTTNVPGKQQEMNVPAVPGIHIQSFQELLSQCNKDHISKALLYMQKALQFGCHANPTEEQKTLLEDAVRELKQAEMEEKYLYIENAVEEPTDMADVEKTRLPPPPILLSRTDTKMVFRPAPFNPISGAKVAWYRIFARKAAGANVKVRLNDYFLPGSGQPVPSFRCELSVSALTPGERYMFAVAAFTADGKLIGGMVGDSTKAILASHPMPVLMAWAYLSQTAYQVGHLHAVTESSLVLWRHFVAQPPPPEQVVYVTSVERDFKLTLLRLNKVIVAQTSPVLLRMFLASIFAYVDVQVKQGQLYCDCLSDSGPLYPGQTKRLRMCERMLLALELSGWLNESSLALQAVIQSYGLLAPLIHYRIPAVPVMQVLERCLIVLQEIPPSQRKRRSQTITEGLHHMIACLTYHLAKVLRMWNQKALAGHINEAGRKMLSVDMDKETEEDVFPGIDKATDNGSVAMTTQKDKKKGGAGAAGAAKGKKATQVSSRDDIEETRNEELRALEEHILCLSRQSQGEQELIGNEDPGILHAYITYLPSRFAYNQVVKFKRRARYLEFFVQVAEKALAEEAADLALDWCLDTSQWLSKRNDGILGIARSSTNVGSKHGVSASVGDDKKYAAAMVEYSRDKPSSLPSGRSTADDMTVSAHTNKTKDSKQVKTKGSKGKVKGGGRYRPIGVTSSMTDAQKEAQEELEMKAIAVLDQHFLRLYQYKQKLRRLRRITADEMPWRAQLNLVHGLCSFEVFLGKLDFTQKIYNKGQQFQQWTSFLDPEWFTMETAGTMVVAGMANVSHQHLPSGDTAEKSRSDISKKSMEQMVCSGIQVAAAIATGRQLTGTFPIPLSDIEPPLKGAASVVMTTKGKKEQQWKQSVDVTPISQSDATQMLDSTFGLLQKALVLAHRGQHWMLLQNVCRAMWNTVATAMLHVQVPDQQGKPLISMATLRSLAWPLMWTAADSLLSMVVQLQQQQHKLQQKKKKKVEPLSEPIKSAFGSTEDETGGATLKFENPLDDITTVDLRLLRRIALRSLELLHYANKWERLVDIAYRFTAITGSRYAEQVLPVMIYTQRKLIERVREYDGHLPPQRHFRAAMESLGGGPISPQQYVSLQLKTIVLKEDLSVIDVLAMQIDPEGQDHYQGATHALKQCCVPLDIDYSLRLLREALGDSQYTARALNHSRQLLSLYLAGQTSVTFATVLPVESVHDNRVQSKVEFIPNTARPQAIMPVDLTQEEFHFTDDIENTSFPSSQISVAIASYRNTIEMLLAADKMELAAEAMHELGNLHFHINDIRAAYKWWADVLDALLGTRDAIHSWRGALPGGTERGQWLLAKCGLWGCLLGGVVASNIAQYILTCNLGMRRECCFLAGYFFKALFRSSFPHPTADKDYALYEVGEGCEVEILMSGVDLLSERFRLNGRILVAALRFVTEELVRGRHSLFVLPLLTLYQYFTTSVCRDLQRTVDGRIMRVRALTELGFFSEAILVLQRLLNGDKLPLTTTAQFHSMEGRPFNVRFNTAKPLLDLTNLKVLENLVARQLSTKLASLYGPDLTCHLALVHAHLLIAIADTIPLLPVFTDVTVPGNTLIIEPSQPRAPSCCRSSRASTDSAHATTKSPPAKPKNKLDVDDETETGSSVKRGAKCFTNPKKPLTLEIVKGTLLAAADFTLSSMSEVIIENANMGGGVSAMSAPELELVILCRLDLAAIANQQHHCPLAARIILTAIKMLQDTSVFRPKMETPSTKRTSSFKKMHMSIEPSTTEGSKKEAEVEGHHHSRARLDAQLWLHCKHALVHSMAGEMRGMGLVKGEESSVKQELGDVRRYCEEGVSEAGACGDDEMQAEFLLQSVLLDMVDGTAMDDMKTALDEILKILTGVRQLSTRGQLLQVITLVHLTDLRAVVSGNQMTDGVVIVDFTKGEYIDAQQQLLQQLEEHGEKIVRRYGNTHEHDTPVAPLGNIYLPHLTYLVQVKLRIGHAMARLTALTSNDSHDDPVTLWSPPLSVLATAAELCKVIPARSSGVEAEIFLNMGKLQRKLFHHGKGHQKVVADTLISAIKVSLANEHDLGLIRQAYLELAILYMSSSGLIALTDRGILDAVALADRPGTESAAMSRAKKHRSRASSSNKTRDSTPTTHSIDGDTFMAVDTEREMERESERKAAWAAVRCAAAVGQSHRSLSLLIGHSAVTSLKVGANTDPPEFAALDLVGSYVIGERKRIYKNEIEEEMAPLVEILEPPPVEMYNDQLRKAKTTIQELSWIHILGYQSILQRLCATATLAVSSSDDSPTQPANPGKLGSEFDLGFISHAQCSVGINENVVRNVLFSAPWMLRLSNLHRFLSRHLSVYASDCTAIYPPLTLQLPASPDNIQAGLIPVIKTTYSGNLSAAADLPPEVSKEVMTSRPQSVSGGRHSTKSLLAIADNDLCMQWYRPSLDEYSIQPPQPSVGSSMRPDVADQVIAPDKQVMLLFATSKKPDKMTTSVMWVSQTQLVDLHDRLTVLKQRAEITLGEVLVKKEASLVSVASSKGSKKQTRVKAVSPKLKRDEHLEVLLGQCLSDVLRLMRVVSVSDETLQSLLLEEQPMSPVTIQSGNTPAMGTAMSTAITATPTNATTDTLRTAGAAEERVQISFDVTKVNMQIFEQLFDPSSGGFLKHPKMLSWFLSLFPTHNQ